MNELIIKASSEYYSEVAIGLRDFFLNTLHYYDQICIVPFGVKKIFIFEEEDGEYLHYDVSLWSDYQEIDKTEKWIRIEYAQNYASLVAAEAGLAESDIRIITEKEYKKMFKNK
jgi:hypothetical protein